ncbi:MAG TPA: hypothetical protein VH595_16615 [Verrucomicrobiae bacterium]|nr:hypothetical protein [Verrucomicrobiae bacterium]
MSFRKCFTALISFLVVAACFGIPMAGRAQILTVVATNLVDVSQIPGNETDPAIAIDLLSPSNMIVAAAIDSQPAGLLISTTTNMGATWATNLIATNDDSQGLPPAYGEPSVAWDTYGNLFVAYLPATLEGVVVALSTNNGQTFGVLTNLAAQDSTDQPKITTPPSGVAAGTVWVVYKDYSMAGTPLVVQGMQSGGLGTNGVFTPAEIVPNSTDGGFADIATGPEGEVMVGFQNNTYSTGLAQIFISVNTNEISTNGLGTNDFPLPIQVVTNAIGGFTYIGAEETGIGVNAALSLAWDCDPFSTSFDRGYLTYTGESTNGNLVIDFCYSTNNGGAGWGAVAQINDDTGQNDHFLPRMAVDPVTGIIGFSWLDCRNDQGSSSTVITKVFIDKVTLTGFMVTNLVITPTNALLNNPSITYSWTDNNGSNLTISISGNDIVGALATNDSADNIYIYGGTNTNFVINAQGAATNFNATVTIVITDQYPDAFTSGNGSADQSAIAYATASLDGGVTFQPNLPLVSFTLPINPPADGYASSLVGSDSIDGWGHYTALAAYGANFFPVWPDNSDILTNNPDGANTNFDLYTLSGGMTIPTADVSVFVTNSPNPVISDGTLVYTMIISNNGPKPAMMVVATNVLPQNVTLVAGGVKPALGGTYQLSGQDVIFAFPTLAANASLTNTIRVTATSSALATNFVLVAASQIDLFPTNNTNTLILLISGQDIGVGMTASETNVLIGDTVTNWIVVTNLGPAANQPVLITDQLSANWTNIAVQTPGASSVSSNVVSINLGILPVNQAVTSIVTAVALSQGSFASSLATVSSLDTDTNLANNSAAIIYSVQAEDLAINVSASPTNINLGDTVTYTVTVSNVGLSFTGDITITNLISTNLGQINIIPSQGEAAVFNNGANNVVTFDLGQLPTGQVATQILTAVALSGPHFATNIGMLGSTDFETNQLSDFATNVISINGEDLAISMSAAPLSLQVGQTVTFTESVTNLGPSTNGTVLVTNVLSSKLGRVAVVQPAGNYTLNGDVVVFNFGALAPGQTGAITLTAIPQSAGTATNTATVFSSGFDTNLVNNSARTLVTITPALPMISNVVVTPLASSAFIRWNTGAPATGQVQYGLTPSYGSVTSMSTAPSSNHLAVLTGLAPDTNYYFNILSWVAGTRYSTNGAFSTSDTLILNTQDASYSGIWNASSVGAGIYLGGYYQAANTTNINPTAGAVYTPNIPAAGAYDVSIWYPQSPIFTTNAQVYVAGATNELLTRVNQTTGGGAWDLIATNFYFASGKGGNVTIYNDTGETNKSIVANAMRWVYDAGQDDPANGTVPAWWAEFFFGTNTLNGAADVDGDGYSNYAEYVLGTDPTDPNSYLNLSVVSAPSGGVSVVFSPWQGGRIYELLAATNLPSPVWTPMTNTVSVNTNGDGVFTITQPNAANNFYRLSAQIAPQ